MKAINNLKQHFSRASMVEKLIYINVAIFIVGLLVSSLSGLYNSQLSFIDKWFALPSSLSAFITKPWTIISYGFLHAGFLHILSNCLWLYLFGRLFSEYSTPKQLLNFYVLGTFFGGLLFLIAMNYFPAFKDGSHILVGASAGVSAIIIGTAAYIPNYELKFPFIGYIKVWHLATFFVVLDLISLSGSNGGGHFAHLGGALFGFLYINYSSNKELDIFASFRKIFRQEKLPLKTVHKSKNIRPKESYKLKSEHQQKVDIILEKIGKSGYDALSKEEKKFLFKQGKNNS